MRRTAVFKYAIDSVGLCYRNCGGVPGGTPLVAEAVSAITGWDFTKDEFLKVGERVLQLERAFNVKRGLVPSDDYEVSKRLIEAPADGRAKGKSIAPYLRGMVMEYYGLVGWDQKTGKPYRDALEKVGLEDVARDLWGEIKL